MRVLLIEDSSRLRANIAAALRHERCVVDVAGDGEEGLWRAQTLHYDVVVLDIMLPKRDGLSVLQELRQKKDNTHILLLTARDTVEDRVRGLALGADDYLVKPFALDELLARVQALGRRAYADKQPILHIGHLTIDTAAKHVSAHGKDLALHPREYRLLEYLVRRRGEVVSHAEIEAHLYDDAVEVMSNAVESCVCALRRKISRRGSPQLVHTRRGLGYILKT
jgi:DNA-binding response OmpR family regulator